MLGRGELRCIGATTLDEYRKHIEKDPALERRFQQVYVDQPTVTDTISILRGLRERSALFTWSSSLFCILHERNVCIDRTLKCFGTSSSTAWPLHGFWISCYDQTFMIF